MSTVDYTLFVPKMFERFESQSTVEIEHCYADEIFEDAKGYAIVDKERQVVYVIVRGDEIGLFGHQFFVNEISLVDMEPCGEPIEFFRAMDCVRRVCSMIGLGLENAK